MGPIVDEIAAEHQGRLKVVKVNAEESPVTTARFAVRAVPTLLVLKEGRVVEQMLGAVPKSRITRAIASVLGA
ncbi:MAG TPA: thioredoxin domain-containing protein [Candidatus Binatus sp.]|nr:thioredoxin domain-containing protein [Candidatus Binatus sp.]